MNQRHALPPSSSDTEDGQEELQSPIPFLLLTFVLPVIVILILGMVDIPKLLGL